MGLFTDFAKASSGATFGALTTIKGMEAAESIASYTLSEAERKYKEDKFDNVIRNDLNHLLVLNKLPEIAYPFPIEGIDKPAAGFFQRHKVFSIGLVMILISSLFSAILPFGSSLRQNMTQIGGFGVLLALFSGIGMIIKKPIKTGSSLIQKHTFKQKLVDAGKKYWHVREYVRQSLDAGSIDRQSALDSLGNTSLLISFPDTKEEILANNFYFKKELGIQ
ncbi:hypothetical protein ACQRBF_05815 [Peptoniphilaceae bacterium SGI.131]